VPSRNGSGVNTRTDRALPFRESFRKTLLLEREHVDGEEIAVDALGVECDGLVLLG
jgi:hypothetical protein